MKSNQVIAILAQSRFIDLVYGSYNKYFFLSSCIPCFQNIAKSFDRSLNDPGIINLKRHHSPMDLNKIIVWHWTPIYNTAKCNFCKS